MIWHWILITSTLYPLNLCIVLVVGRQEMLLTFPEKAANVSSGHLINRDSVIRTEKPCAAAQPSAAGRDGPVGPAPTTAKGEESNVGFPAQTCLKTL